MPRFSASSTAIATQSLACCCCYAMSGLVGLSCRYKCERKAWRHDDRWRACVHTGVTFMRQFTVMILRIRHFWCGVMYLWRWAGGIHVGSYRLREAVHMMHNANQNKTDCMLADICKWDYCGFARRGSQSVKRTRRGFEGKLLLIFLPIIMLFNFFGVVLYFLVQASDNNRHSVVNAFC